jgi:hypothetical protein
LNRQLDRLEQRLIDGRLRGRPAEVLERLDEEITRLEARLIARSEDTP